MNFFEGIFWVHENSSLGSAYKSRVLAYFQRKSKVAESSTLMSNLCDARTRVHPRRKLTSRVSVALFDLLTDSSPECAAFSTYFRLRSRSPGDNWISRYSTAGFVNYRSSSVVTRYALMKFLAQRSKSTVFGPRTWWSWINLEGKTAFVGKDSKGTLLNIPFACWSALQVGYNNTSTGLISLTRSRSTGKRYVKECSFRIFTDKCCLAL